MSPAMIGLVLVAGALGAVLARALHFPVWPLVGALAGVGAVHLLLLGDVSNLPQWWGVLAQVLIGAAVGSGIKRSVWHEFRMMLVPATMAVVLIISFGVIAGLFVEEASPVGHVVAVLGTVPGGVSEMVASAYALGVNGAVVAGMHIVRLLLTILCMPLLVAIARSFERRLYEKRK